MPFDPSHQIAFVAKQSERCRRIALRIYASTGSAMRIFVRISTLLIYALWMALHPHSAETFGLDPNVSYSAARVLQGGIEPSPSWSGEHRASCVLIAVRKQRDAPILCGMT